MSENNRTHVAGMQVLTHFHIAFPREIARAQNAKNVVSSYRPLKNKLSVYFYTLYAQHGSVVAAIMKRWKIIDTKIIKADYMVLRIEQFN